MRKLVILRFSALQVPAGPHLFVTSRLCDAVFDRFASSPRFVSGSRAPLADGAELEPVASSKNSGLGDLRPNPERFGRCGEVGDSRVATLHRFGGREADHCCQGQEVRECHCVGA
jgi:hypothetical protein